MFKFNGLNGILDALENLFVLYKIPT